MQPEKLNSVDKIDKTVTIDQWCERGGGKEQRVKKKADEGGRDGRKERK